jgi:D-lactate dehydrogenase
LFKEAAMRVAVFSTKPYEKRCLVELGHPSGHELDFFEARLTAQTAGLAAGYPAVSVFVNDELDAATLGQLARGGTRMIATRSAGFNHIDLQAARQLGLVVGRVPAYSPNAISEFTIGLMLMLARQIHRGYNRARDSNFELEGLLGFELRSKTVGIIGTGKIGALVARTLQGFGVTLLAYDPYPNAELAHSVRYVELDELLGAADIISLHLPLTPESRYLIGERTIPLLKRGVMIVNTSRGGLLDTSAVIEALKSGQSGYLAIDVYEEEADLFFRDLSNVVIQDDVFARLQTFPNVVVTAHQAFFSDTALTNIMQTTLANISEFEQTGRCSNEINL